MKHTIRFSVLSCLATGCALFHGCASDSNTQPAPATPIEPVVISGTYEPAEPTEPAVLPQPYTYTVVKGDTLGRILQRSKTRLADVEALNPNLNPNRIRVGQKILLPPTAKTDWVEAHTANPTGLRVSPAGKGTPIKSSYVTEGDTVIYTVGSGDSLSVIAYRFGVKVQTLREANELKGDLIRAGQKLVIPSPTKTPAQ